MPRHLEICVQSLCPENVETLFKLLSFPKDQDLFPPLQYLVDQIADKNYGNVSKCIEIILEKNHENICGLDLKTDLVFVNFVANSHRITKNIETLMTAFMKKIYVGRYQCYEIYDNDSAFSKNFDFMESLLKPGTCLLFINNFKDFMYQYEMLQDESIVSKYNNVAKKYGDLPGIQNYEKLLKIKKSDSAKGSKQLLEIAVEKCYIDVVNYILLTIPNIDVKESIKIACENGYDKIIASLLVKANSNDVKGLLHEVCKRLHLTKDQLKSQDNFQETFNHLLTKFPELVDEEDSDGNIPLHYAVKSSSNTNETSKLLALGSFLGTKQKQVARHPTNDISQTDVKRPINDISQNCLRQFLNDCVKLENQDLTIDLRFMLPRNNSENFNESFLLNEVRKNSRLQPLIAHPVIQTFIYLKWSKIGLICFSNFFLALAFMIASVFYSIVNRYAQPPFFAYLGLFFLFVILVFTVVFGILELCALNRKFSKSMITFLLILKIILIFCTISLLPVRVYMQANYSEYLTLILFLTSSVLFFKSLQLMPVPFLSCLDVSLNIAIFQRVLVTFIKSFIVLLIFPLSFAFTFNVLYFVENKNQPSQTNETLIESSNSTKTDTDKNYHTFQDPILWTVRILTMMTGDFGKIFFLCCQ